MTRWLLCLLVTSFAFGQQNAPTTSAAELLKQGEKLSFDGKQDEALALYRRAMEMSPEACAAYVDTGIALDLKGEYSEARGEIDKGIKLASGRDKMPAERAMAMSYAFEGKADEAAKFESEVFKTRLDTKDFVGAGEIANELARIFLESGDLANSQKWYENGYQTALKKSDLSDADKKLWLFRWESAQARITARRGNKAEAQQHVAAAKAALDAANNPDQARFWPYLTGYVAFYLGDYKTALADLQKADQHDPLNLALIAQANEKLGDQAQATEYYHKVLASNAHNPTNAYARPLAKKKLGM